MQRSRFSLLLLLACTAGAQAQSSSSSIRESTDPARAAAVEHAASVLSKRPPQPAVGVLHTRTASGQEILSGGISVEDRVRMHKEGARYSLWVATVAKPSGAYLADVALRITDVRNKAVLLARNMEGPWLYIMLAPGAYDVSATYQATSGTPQTLTTRVNIGKQGQRQAVLRFDSTAAVAPEMQSPFKGNPFGASAPAK